MSQQLQDAGIKIGSSTGYTRELMQIVSKSAKEQGYIPECVLCAEDAPRGRPAPYLLFEAAKQLDVFPMWTIVKVDDTSVGIQAGRNAGCWSVGVTKSGNGVGLSEQQLQELPEQEVRKKCVAAETQLLDAGAHYTVDSVADLLPVLQLINQRLIAGELPTDALRSGGPQGSF